MATPRAVRAKTTSELGHESPTRGQLVPGCTITSELYVILEASDIDEDEASNDAAETLNAMGHDFCRVPEEHDECCHPVGVVHPGHGDQVEKRSCDERLKEDLE